MADTLITRRRMLGAMGAVGALAALPGRRARAAGSGAIKVGLVVPQGGVYKPLGDDMKRAWDLWLERHGRKMGKYSVTTAVADEGESPQSGVPAVQKLLQSERVDVVVGIVLSPVAL